MTTSTLKGIIASKASTAFSIELESFVLKSCARMRRASPYQRVPVTLKPRGSINVAEVLNCSPARAVAVIKRTAFIQALIRKGLVEVI